MAKTKGVKPVAQNRSARHDFFVEESVECGIALHGTEVKSMRQGKVNLKESYAQIRDNEVLVQSMHISPYEQGSIFNTDPMRPKKLLLHKDEIRKLKAQVQQKGYTLIPLSMYWKHNRAKLDIGLARGKKEHDKRATEKDRDWERDKQRLMRER